MASIRNFFSMVRGSTRGLINPEELTRSIITALGSGSIVCVLIQICQSMLAHVAIIFPSPTASSLATMFLTLILDLLRRQTQGVLPSRSHDPASRSA